MNAAPTQGFTRRMITSLALLSAAMLVLAVIPAAYAFPAVTQGDLEEEKVAVPMNGTPFWPCGTPAVRQAIAQVNEAAPLDIGECEEGEDGAWRFVPGNDTQEIFDLIPEDVPDPGDDVPGPDGVPAPEDLPPQLNRCEHEDWQNWTDQMIGDANCNGWSNIEEVEEGCDPMDPTTNPDTPDRCNLIPPDDPEQLEPWATNWLPNSLNCAGHEEMVGVADQLIGNADCNDYSNIEELEERCNPLNPFSYPGSPFPGACFPEPDPGDPQESANQTVLWAQMQAASAQGAVLGALPVWLAGIIGWLLNQAPDVPEPPE